jgi:hypothetical protein
MRLTVNDAVGVVAVDRGRPDVGGPIGVVDGIGEHRRVR